MSARLSYSVQGPLLTFWLEGDYTVDAYVELVQRAFDDPSTPATVWLLLDGSRSQVDRYPDEVRRLLPAFTAQADRIRRIAAITRTDVHYGMVRMSAAMLERYGIQAHPFRERSAALTWLMSEEEPGLSGGGGLPSSPRTVATRSRYRIDGDDIIRWVSGGWIAFADENARAGWDPESVVGRSVWSYIEGPEIRHLYELLFRRVRSSGVGIDVPFRCDSPDLRRDTRLRIEPLEGGGLQLTVALPTGTSPPDMDEDPDGRAPSRPDLLPLCSWCDRTLVRGVGWVNVEAAVELLELFDGRAVPRLSHGACPDCYSDVVFGAAEPD